MKNKIILILKSFYNASLNSQELDPSFLDSLPEDIKKDLNRKKCQTRP